MIEISKLLKGEDKEHSSEREYIVSERDFPEPENTPDVVYDKFEVEEDIVFEVKSVTGFESRYNSWTFHVEASLEDGDYTKAFRFGMLKKNYTEEKFKDKVRRMYVEMLRDDDEYQVYDAAVKSEEEELSELEGKEFKV